MAIVVASPAAAQQVGTMDSTYEDGILVTSSDVTTCPYVLIRPIDTASTEDYGRNGAREKSFRKLRNDAKKVGADAVVLVREGGKHMTMWAFARREMTGNAIRYVDKTCAPTR
jgi:uncharacterized protein YbjQ (UPF0145 family)